MKQPWHCDHCRGQGIVEMDDHIDVMGGLEAIRADHRWISPNCERFDMVRVANLGMAQAFNGRYEEKK